MPHIDVMVVKMASLATHLAELFETKNSFDVIAANGILLQQDVRDCLALLAELGLLPQTRSGKTIQQILDSTPID